MNDEQRVDQSYESGGITPEKVASPKTRTRVPTKSFWIIVALSIATFVTAAFLNDDPAVPRIAMAFGSLFSSLAFIRWFCLHSVYSLRARRALFMFVVGLVVAGLALVRIESFSGSLKPAFRFVWQKPHDETLEHLPAGNSVVDLTIVSDSDFSQFLGPNRNGVVLGTNLSRDWDNSPPKELWRREIGAGWSGFAVVNGFAVTMEQRGEDELVTCYAVETGEPQWSSAVKSAPPGSVGFPGATQYADDSQWSGLRSGSCRDPALFEWSGRSGNLATGSDC